MLFSRALIPTMKEAPADATNASHVLLLARGVHPARRRRHLRLSAARLPRAPEGRGHRPRGDGPRRRARDPDARAAPGRLLQGDGPLGPLRRRAPAPARPQGRRLPPRADARRDRHRHRAPRDQELARSAEDALPGAGEVPRRAAASRRAAARARVRDEGRVLVRRRREGRGRELRDDAPGVRADLRPHGAHVPHGAGRLGRHRRLDERRVPGARRVGRGRASSRARTATTPRTSRRPSPRPRRRPTRSRRASRERVSTPTQRTIDEVAAFLGVDKKGTLKALLYRAKDGPRANQVVMVVVRGDHELNEFALARALKTTEVFLASDEEVERETKAKVGFAGPVGFDAGAPLRRPRRRGRAPAASRARTRRASTSRTCGSAATTAARSGACGR